MFFYLSFTSIFEPAKLPHLKFIIKFNRAQYYVIPELCSIFVSNYISMKDDRVAEPDYDFEVIEASGADLLGKSFFTSEFAIMKCVNGEATISLNSRNHIFKAGTNFMLTDAIHFQVIECSTDFEIITCRFSILFLNEIFPVLENKVFDVLQYSAPDIFFNKSTECSDMTFRQLCILYQNKNHAYRHRIAVSLVITYMLEIYELTYEHIDSGAINTSNYASYLLGSFCAMCNDNHTRHRNIEYYSNALNISSRYLYKITKDAFNSTPKQVIDYYVSGTAKKLLLTTIFTKQQIADMLSFPDQATFGQFFKRNVGMTPSEFRSKYR